MDLYPVEDAQLKAAEPCGTKGSKMENLDQVDKKKGSWKGFGSLKRKKKAKKISFKDEEVNEVTENILNTHEEPMRTETSESNIGPSEQGFENLDNELSNILGTYLYSMLHSSHIYV